MQQGPDKNEIEETNRNIDALNRMESEESSGSFAGTNPDRNPADQPEDADNPIDAQEAQNVTDGVERLSGEEAKKATNKAHGG